jgi:hypothetical protein
MTSPRVRDLAAGQLPVEGPIKRFTVSLRAEDQLELRAFASQHRVSLSQAVRLAIRHAMADPPAASATAEETAAGEELALHNLVATEQVIKLLERFLPGGPAAAAEVLPLAIGAAQLRIADSGRVSR